MKFEDIASIGTCDVCGKEVEVAVLASTMGPVSFAYCRECFKNGLEPYGAMVSYIACAGHYPKDINPAYINEVKRNLEYRWISEDKFSADVNECIKSIDNYFGEANPD